MAHSNSSDRGENKKDLAWGVLLGALLAISPLSGAARILPSIILGALLAASTVAIRRVARRRAPGFLAAPTDSALIARPTLAVWVLLGATLILFLPTLHWLYQQYTVSVWRNAHGMFLPVIVVVLARSRLRADPDCSAASSVWGIPVIVVGALLALLDASVHSGLIGSFGLIVVLPGLSLLLLGARRTRLIAFPLALSVFLLPLPEYLPNPFWLPSATSFMIEQYFDVLGVPSTRLQTYFKLPVGFFGVSTNCSGLSAFYAASLIGILMVAATRSWQRRTLILLSIWPLTVVINGVRGAGLIWMCNRYGTGISDTPIHGLSGIATLLAVVCVLLVLADWRSLARAKA